MREPEHSVSTPAATRFGLVAIGFHWLLALAIVASFSVGLYMNDLPFSVQRVKLFNYHKWAGVTILVLSVLRLLWRVTHRPPPLSQRVQAAMPPWQHRAANFSHFMMYLLFLAVPLLGWAYSSAAGLQIVWFGVLPLPDFVPVDKEFAKEVLKPLHRYLAYILAGLVVVHVAAALKHQFVDRDGLMARMWPGGVSSKT
ncbi:MAG: cytochrome b [Rubrivivax sp.]